MSFTNNLTNVEIDGNFINFKATVKHHFGKLANIKVHIYGRFPFFEDWTTKTIDGASRAVKKRWIDWDKIPKAFKVCFGEDVQASCAQKISNQINP